MRKIILPLTIFATIVVGLAHAGPAKAQIRTFVAGNGVDSNPCSATQPCRTFQRAHDAVGANGEIDVLTPAGYGVLTITKAISIQGHGVASIAAPSGNGITVSAGPSDKINLRGLLVDGVATGSEGLFFTAGASLNIQDCVFRNFFHGIDFKSGASSDLSVSNTQVADNNSSGIFIEPTGSGTVMGVLDNVESNNNARGINVDGRSSTGTVQFTISNSLIANNTAEGILVRSAPGQAATVVMVRSSTVADNGSNGLRADSSLATLRVTRSAITGNVTGFSAINGGTLSSYGDNNLDGNGTNGTPTGALSPH